MKKLVYIAPAIRFTEQELEENICAGSVTGVGGDAGITKPDPGATPPSSGDARQGNSLWDFEE